ncbi:LLM class oxidoreductase [Cohnella faecalis]|uniref:hypothetical protein n=1 Tax=Cohnella faecalis TaxID=2315694 RepID=UPI001F1E704B|nr:hypothetical protein [Cohnella faecalis]
MSTEGTLALLSSWSGIDFSAFGRDELLAFIERKGNGSQYIADYLSRASAERPLTVPDLAKLYAFGGIENVAVGSAEQIAERMIAFADATGIDGFNVAYAIRPASVRDFADLVVPELQRLGRVQSEYEAGSLRGKLFGHGDRLKPGHPGTRTELNANAPTS